MSLGRQSVAPFQDGLSVFFPAYNDAESLPSLVARTFAVLHEIANDFEVIVVDDGSQDDTAEVLESLRIKYQPLLRVVTHPRNLGYGAALRSGFAASTKEFVFYTDGDGQYEPTEIRNLIQALTPGTDWVNGYKIERNDPWHRVMIGATYNWLARRMFGLSLRDVDCDFRLIRRSKLKVERLSSTAGTICAELAHHLESAGAKLTEVPVHHYPRVYGKSQFFRIRPLITTFQQLCALYLRLIVMPALTMARPTGWGFAAMMFVIAGLSFLTYGRSLAIPFISDDYLQIQLGREYGPVSGWNALFGDALHRCRATSLVLTYWTERLFGLDPLAYNVSTRLLHILNSGLVLALGYWRPVGWRAAAVAACFFAVSQRHSEAVIWYSSVPELLVFCFTLTSFLCWVWWLQERTHRAAAYAAALVLFVLGLLSKESAVAVVPLLLLAAWLSGDRQWRRFLAVAPFALLSAAYFGVAFAAKSDHLHFNDGTFSLAAPFLTVLARSSVNLLWIWGLAALIAVALLRASEWRNLLWIGTIWITATLLPYSFLTYMPRVPSRHTYFASVGLAFIVAAGIFALRKWSMGRNWRWAAPLACCAMILHQSGYIWTVKHNQYVLRAQPTEDLLIRATNQSGGRIYAKCFPYPPVIAEQAFRVRSIHAVLITGKEAKDNPAGVDFCNSVAHE